MLQSSINWQQDQNTLGLIIIINWVSGSTALICLRLKAKSERFPFTISKLSITIIGNNVPIFTQIDLVIMGNNDAIITWIIDNNNKLVKIRPSNFFLWHFTTFIHVMITFLKTTTTFLQVFYPTLFRSVFFTPPYKHPFGLKEHAYHHPPHLARQHPTRPNPALPNNCAALKRACPLCPLWVDPLPFAKFCPFQVSR